MPSYEYVCEACMSPEERIVPIGDRDSQVHFCGGHLKRNWTFQGIVWSPTRNNGYS